MKSKIKGWTMLVFIGIILIAACFVPSTHAKANSRYILVDSWVSGLKRVCLYENSRGEQITESISKGKSCRYVY